MSISIPATRSHEDSRCLLTVNQEMGLNSRCSDEDKGRVPPGLQKQLRYHWSLHNKQNETVNEGLVTSRRQCEEALVVARRLWSECETLVYAAAALEDSEEHSEITGVLLAESKKLLTACDELIVSKEEILQVYELSAER